MLQPYDWIPYPKRAKKFLKHPINTLTTQKIRASVADSP